MENKELLLKYLCMALPYGVLINYKGLVRPLFSVAPTQHFQITLDNALDGKDNGLVYISLDEVELEEFKPYLRPMSSMTDEEEFEYRNVYVCPINNSWDVVDWLLEHHFDFMGLIPKGIAIEVTDKK